MNSKNQDPRRRQRMAAEDSKTLEYRWGEANRKFDLAKKQIELFKSITSEKEKVLEQYLEASGNCRTLKRIRSRKRKRFLKPNRQWKVSLRHSASFATNWRLLKKRSTHF